MKHVSLVILILILIYAKCNILTDFFVMSAILISKKPVQVKPKLPETGGTENMTKKSCLNVIYPTKISG